MNNKMLSCVCSILMGLVSKAQLPSVSFIGDASSLLYNFDQDNLFLQVIDQGVDGNTFMLAGSILTAFDENMPFTIIFHQFDMPTASLQTEYGMTWREWVRSDYNNKVYRDNTSGDEYRLDVFESYLVEYVGLVNTASAEHTFAMTLASSGDYVGADDIVMPGGEYNITNI